MCTDGALAFADSVRGCSAALSQRGPASNRGPRAQDVSERLTTGCIRTADNGMYQNG